MVNLCDWATVRLFLSQELASTLPFPLPQGDSNMDNGEYLFLLWKRFFDLASSLPTPSCRAQKLHLSESNPHSKQRLLCLHAYLCMSGRSAAGEQRGYLIFKSLLTSMIPGTWKGHQTFSMNGI